MILYLTKRASHDLSKIPEPLSRTIEKHMFDLSSNPYPSNCKKLQGYDTWRLRVGSFRVIYTIDAKRKEITILRAADRKTVYR